MKRFVWLLIIMMPMLSYINFATENVNDLIFEGNAKLSNGNYQDAIQLFNQVIKLDGKNYLAFYGKGLAYEKLYYLDTAIFNYRKSVFYNDDFDQAFYRSGVLKYNLKLYSQALKDFEKVIILNPNNLEAMLYTAYCFEKMGLFIGASDLYKNLAEKSSNHKEFMLKSCKARIGNEAIENTISHFDSLVIQYPEYDSAYYYRGLCKLNDGMFESAITEFSRVINLNKNYVEAYIYRGRAKQMLDSMNSNVENEDLIVWKQIQPDFIDIELEKAYNYYFDSSYYDAIEHFNIVIAADSGRTDAMLSLGMCYYGVKNYVQSLNFVNRILHKSPQNIDAELLKAKIFHGIQKEKEKQIQFSGIRIVVTITSSDVRNDKVIEVLKHAMDMMMRYDGFKEPIYHRDSILVSTEKIIKLDSTNIEGFLIRAEASSNRSIDSVAESCYKKAIELSNEPECYFKRGLFYLKKKDYNKSLDDFIKAYELGYQTLEIKILKIILYEITERDAFRSAYLSSVFTDELLNANANYLYGYYLLEYLHDSHTAIKYFNNAIELDPYYYDAHIYRNLARKKK